MTTPGLLSVRGLAARGDCAGGLHGVRQDQPGAGSESLSRWGHQALGHGLGPLSERYRALNVREYARMALMFCLD